MQQCIAIISFLSIQRFSKLPAEKWKDTNSAFLYIFYITSQRNVKTHTQHFSTSKLNEKHDFYKQQCSHLTIVENKTGIFLLQGSSNHMNNHSKHLANQSHLVGKTCQFWKRDISTNKEWPNQVSFMYLTICYKINCFVEGHMTIVIENSLEVKETLLSSLSHW